MVQSGDVFADYGGPDSGAIHQIFSYNARSEVTAGATYLGATPTDQSTPLSARKHEFSYDAIGNRKTSNTSGRADLADDYTVNSLNQYTARENNTLAVGGTADSGARVVAGESATAVAGRAGAHWGDNVVLPNSSGPYQGPLKVFAAKNVSGTDKIRTETVTASIPPAAETFTYDDDGNILTDGIWLYTWDAENRLVAMETKSAVIGAGIASADARRLEFKYDYQHRRVQKLVLAGWNGTTFATTLSTTRFLYDGWNLIAEYSVSSGTLSLVRSYTWGLDITGASSAAGGPGCLLQIADHASGKTFLPCYDGNGNVVALVNGSSGALAACYEYSPYGEFLRCESPDPVVADQPFRYSTKFYDGETGLYNYGMRYFSPSQGRFLGRDPKQEAGGLNLHGFCFNNPINMWDVLGMDPSGPATSGATHSEVVVINGIVYNRTWTAESFIGEGEEWRWGDPSDEAVGTLGGDGIIDLGLGNGSSDTVGIPEDGGARTGVVTVTVPVRRAPTRPAVPTTLIINIAFEAGVTDQRIALTYLSTMQDALDAYATANNVPRITIVPNIQRGSVTAPAGGGWGASPATTAALAGVGGAGRISIIIASSNVTRVTADGTEILRGAGYQGLGAVINSNNAGPYTLTHEIGHVLGWVMPGQADPNHSTSPTNIMHNPSPNVGTIDAQYYNLANALGQRGPRPPTPGPGRGTGR